MAINVTAQTSTESTNLKKYSDEEKYYDVFLLGFLFFEITFRYRPDQNKPIENHGFNCSKNLNELIYLMLFNKLKCEKLCVKDIFNIKLVKDHLNEFYDLKLQDNQRKEQTNSNKGK